MIKQLVFVIDGLILVMHKSNVEKNEAKIHDEQLVDLFVLWNKMYLLSNKKFFLNLNL